MIALYILLGCILGVLLCYGALQKDLKATRERNDEIEQENLRLDNDNDKLRQENQRVLLANTTLKQENSSLVARRQDLIENITAIERSQKASIEEQYSAYTEVAQKAFETRMQEYADEADQWEEDAKQEYETLLKELSAAATDKMRQCAEAQKQLDDLQKTVAAIVESRKRDEEIRTAADFYRLNISETDKEEIAKLRTIIPYLRDPAPLNKIIYKVYYENAYTALVGRVIGSGRHTGIYKITNIENGMCYVGQAVDLAERWKQHIRRGLGADAPTRNKLYPAMATVGVENFTFEVLEECSAKDLDAKEDFYQNFFKAKEFGYSIK